MEMRDMSNLPNVAQPKTQDDMDRRLEALKDDSSQSVITFTSPERNVAQIGVDNGMRVADFGAGSGMYTFAMAERIGKSGRVYAVDVQRDLLRRIKNEAENKGLKNIDVIWGDFEDDGGSKLANGVVELVVMSNVLFQLDDKRGAFKEAWRILRDGGKLAVVDWSESYGNMGPHESAVVTQSQTLDLAVKTGFIALQGFDAGAHHYGLLFRKPLSSKADTMKTS